MLESAVLTVGLLLFQLHFTCSAPCFFRSRYVRAATLLSKFTGKKVVSVVVVFKIKVARDFYVTKLSKESALPGVFVDFWVARGEVPPPRYGCRRLLASPRGIKLSLRTCRSNSVSYHFTQTFPEKVLVFSNHALLKSFAQRNVRNRAFPTSDCVTCRIVDRSMDPEVLTAKGQVPHDEACRSLRTSTVSFSNCSHHKQLGRLTPLSFVRVGSESRFLFLFSESGREECSSGRNDAPGLRVLGAKLRLHKVFGRKTSRSSRKMRLCARIFRALFL